jgi:hypothetical protein
MGRGLGFTGQAAEAKSKSTTPQSLVRDFELPLACGEREGAERLPTPSGGKKS